MNYSNLTKTQVIEGIQNDVIKIYDLSNGQRDDKDIVLETIKKHGFSLQYASIRLKNDKEFVLEVVKIYCEALQYASTRLKDDKEIVLQAVKIDGFAVRYASDRLINDRDVVLEAVNQNGYALFCLPSTFQEDKELLEVLEKNVNNISYVDNKEWYQEKMEVLANIRRQQEKEIIENSITSNNIATKKIKF